MPTSPMKRPSGGRLRRLLASLRPPARAGPLPVQTGFQTSLADIVVKNHGRLRNPRRRHRAAVPPPAAAAEPEAEQRRELSVAHHDAAAPAPAPVTVTARHGKGADGLSVRPGLLAAVVLALLVIWSKQLVAAATIASVALSWIEYVRTVGDRRPEKEKMMDSPIREAAESPRPGCVSDDGGSDGALLWSAANDGCDDSSSPVNNNPKRKQSRRSLRKLLASKLRSGEAGEHNPVAGEANAESAPSENAAGAPTEDDRCRRGCGRGALPLPALVAVILVGLVAGKLPALALAVLCAAFSSSSSSSSSSSGLW